MSQYNQSYQTTTSYSNQAPVGITQSYSLSSNVLQTGSNAVSTGLTNAGITDKEGAKQVARRIFENFDQGKKGKIDNSDTVPMICESYKTFNQHFAPSQDDQKAFFKTLDRNGDGVVTLPDIEALCIRYLTVLPQEEHVKKSKQYTAEVEARLDVARRLFKRYDRDGSGRLQDEEIVGLLKDTYAEMGMQNFQPTPADIKIWLQMADSDNDEVTLEQYEGLVIKSLMKSGIRIEKQSLVI